MTKEQQIEELTMLLFNEAENYCYADGEISLNMLAETLYNAGYRKVPENERFVNNMKNVLEIEKENAVKAFAEHLKKYAIKTNSPEWGLMEFVEVRDIDKLLLTNY